jgi:hypothetical protein
MLTLWVVMLYGLLGRQNVSGEHTASIFRAEERMFLGNNIYLTSSHGVTPPKTNIGIFPPVRTLNLTKEGLF